MDSDYKTVGDAGEMKDQKGEYEYPSRCYQSVWEDIHFQQRKWGWGLDFVGRSLGNYCV